MGESLCSSVCGYGGVASERVGHEDTLSSELTRYPMATGMRNSPSGISPRRPPLQVNPMVHYTHRALRELDQD
jgi:hypothetical protein